MNRLIARIEKAFQTLGALLIGAAFAASLVLWVGVPQATAASGSHFEAEPTTGNAALKTQQRRTGEDVDRQSQSLTPEATSYEVDGDGFSVGIKSSNDRAPLGTTDFGRDAKQNIKDATDTIREKLNLDEPIYPGTKEFINDVEQRVEDVVESVTGGS